MPDILTHIAFADEILGKINLKILSSEISKRKELYRLGAQGPDVFYYYKFLSEQNNINRIGNMLHEEKTGIFLKRSFDYIVSKQLNEEDYFSIVSYVTGFLCHYILDKNVHPFVYRFSGFCFEMGAEKGAYCHNHKIMENMIDVYVWHDKKNTHAYKQPVYSLIGTDRDLPAIIKTYLQDTIQDVYDIRLTKKEIYCAYKNMITAFKLLYDPYKIKKNILKGLEKIRGKNIILGKPFYSSNIDESKKYMNFEKVTWTHPLDENEVYNYSFMELYDKAIEECLRMMYQILAAIEKRETIDINIIGNKSYLTNLKYDSKPNLVKAEAIGLLERGGCYETFKKNGKNARS